MSIDDIRKSNQAKEEVCDNVLMSLIKKKILSDEELQTVEDVFYSTTEGYVFMESRNEILRLHYVRQSLEIDLMEK